jgi:hypothetical protein
MYDSWVYYPSKDKEVIEDALQQLNELVFDCWIIPPKVFLGEIYCEEEGEDGEIPVRLEYENPKDEDACQSCHTAMDLVQAFLAGVLYKSKKDR